MATQTTTMAAEKSGPSAPAGGKKSILFDLDGTLVDSLGDLAAAVRKTLQEQGHPNPEAFSPQAVRPHVGRGARFLIAGVMAEAWGEPVGAIDDAEVDKTLRHFRENYEAGLFAHTRPYAGIPEVLQALKKAGTPMAVTTNKPSALARQVVDKLLPGFFDVILGPEDAAHKPDPAMLFEAAKRLGHPPLCLVGDSTVDAACAKRAEIPCVAVLWGLGEKEDLEKQTPHLAEAPNALLGLVAALADAA
jgi:phosphoglycolate phosphatase